MEAVIMAIATGAVIIPRTASVIPITLAATAMAMFCFIFRCEARPSTRAETTFSI